MSNKAAGLNVRKLINIEFGYIKLGNKKSSKQILQTAKLLLISLTIILGGCGSTIDNTQAAISNWKLEPWVKPFERSNLADPIMSLNRNPIALAYAKHVSESREGARGADGGAGGGCGCN